MAEAGAVKATSRQMPARKTGRRILQRACTAQLLIYSTSWCGCCSDRTIPPRAGAVCLVKKCSRNKLLGGQVSAVWLRTQLLNEQTPGPPSSCQFEFERTSLNPALESRSYMQRSPSPLPAAFRNRGGLLSWTVTCKSLEDLLSRLETGRSDLRDRRCDPVVLGLAQSAGAQWGRPQSWQSAGA